MRHRPPASVIIPNLNSAVVGEVVDEVARQGQAHGETEIIVVGRDDANILGGRSHIRFIETPQPMLPGAARNLGLSLAKGEQIVFLDADCIPQPGWLETLLQHQWRHGCVVSGALVLEKGNYWIECANVAWFREFMASLPPSERRFLPTFNLCGRRSAFLEAGGFDERFRTAEDLDLTGKLHERGHSLCFEPHARVVHRPSRRSLTALLSYGYLCGSNSIRARALHPRSLPTPALAFHWLALLALSPLAAGATVWRTFGDDRTLRSHLATAPVVFLVKMAWLAGAAEALRRRQI